MTYPIDLPEGHSSQGHLTILLDGKNRCPACQDTKGTPTMTRTQTFHHVHVMALDGDRGIAADAAELELVKYLPADATMDVQSVHSCSERHVAQQTRYHVLIAAWTNKPVTPVEIGAHQGCSACGRCDQFVTTITEYTGNAMSAREQAAMRAHGLVSRGYFKDGYDAFELTGPPEKEPGSFFRGVNTWKVPVRYYHRERSPR